LLERLKLDEAAVVLVELKLRGDWDDVLGAMGREAQRAIRSHCAAAADPSAGLSLPPDAAPLLDCKKAADLVKVLQAIKE